MDPNSVTYLGGQLAGDIVMVIGKCQSLSPGDTLTNVDGSKITWTINESYQTSCGYHNFQFSGFQNSGTALEKGDYVFLGYGNNGGPILYSNFSWTISYRPLI